jgi:sugar lactone lactonase YvrE
VNEAIMSKSNLKGAFAVVSATLILASGSASAQPAPAAAAPPVPSVAYPGDYNVSARSDADKALPNPYARNETHFKIPKGLVLGSVSGIDVTKDGKSIWVTQRCGGQDYCIGSDADPVWRFDASGKIVKTFGKGMVVYPHGLYVDRDDNVWIVDVRTNTHEQGNQSAKRLPGAKPNGAQVLKFSPEGKLLLTLGVPGEYGTDERHLSQPSAVVTAPNGDIFVGDGHDSAPSNNRIMKFDKTGKFIKAWGKSGSGPEDLNCPHALAMDSQGRLFVADRGNDRIQVYDQDGKLLASWKQFGRPSGLYIDKNDVLYVADSQSGVRQKNAYVRGVHVGSARTGAVTAFMPDPLGNPSPWFPLRGTSGAEGITAANGAVYVSQVTPPGLVIYTPK